MQVAAAENAGMRNISLGMHTLSPDTSLAGQVPWSSFACASITAVLMACGTD